MELPAGGIASIPKINGKVGNDDSLRRPRWGDKSKYE
jgi:hypothetical protein